VNYGPAKQGCGRKRARFPNNDIKSSNSHADFFPWRPLGASIESSEALVLEFVAESITFGPRLGEVSACLVSSPPGDNVGACARGLCTFLDGGSKVPYPGRDLPGAVDAHAKEPGSVPRRRMRDASLRRRV
jgi:hypothetical protein